MGFSQVSCPGGLNNTLLSQCRIVENSSHRGTRKQNIPSKERGGGEEPLIAWVWFADQPIVMSS